jgi:hypothetical protein
MALFISPFTRATDASNNALSGAELYFYATGTTTLATVYSDSGLSTTLSNPVVADAGGKFANIYLDPAVTYRAVMKTGGGATLFDVDPYDRSLAPGDLAGDDGSGLIGFLQVKASDKFEQEIALPDVRQSSADDEVDALAELISDGYRRIRLPGGKGFGDGGDYRLQTPIGTNNIVNGLQLIGDGPERTRIGKTDYTETYPILFHNSGSADPEDNLVGLRLQGLTLYDDVVGLGFSEQTALAHLNGVTGATFEDVHFVGMRGDGVLIGSGHLGGQERHNRDIKFLGCTFDGINKNNRNGISFIDVDGALVWGCRFQNLSKPGDGGTLDPFDPNTGPGMPGAIDCEPDVSGYPILRNVQVVRARFDNIGTICFAMLLHPNDLMDEPHRNFVMDGFHAQNVGSLFALNGYTNGNLAAATEPYGMRIVNGAVQQASQRAFLLQGAYGVTVENVLFDRCEPANIGLNGGNRNIDVRRNTFRGANTNGVQLTIDADLSSSRMEDNLVDGVTGRFILVRDLDADLTRLRVNGNEAVNADDMTAFVARVGGTFTGTYSDLELRDNAVPAAIMAGAGSIADAFTGPANTNRIETSRIGNKGNVRLESVDAPLPGYVEFLQNGARQGFIGYGQGDYILAEASGFFSGYRFIGRVDTNQHYRVDDVQVVSNRATGWTAPTGTATRTTFATGSATLGDLAERLKALIDDLTAHGLIGA